MPPQGRTYNPSEWEPISTPTRTYNPSEWEPINKPAPKKGGWSDIPGGDFAWNFGKKIAYDFPKSMLEMMPARQSLQSEKLLTKLKYGTEEEKRSTSEQIDRDIAELQQQVKEQSSSPWGIAKAGMNALDPTGIVPGYVGLGESFVHDIGEENYGGAAGDVALGLAPWLIGKGLNRTGRANLPQEPRVKVVPPIRQHTLSEVAGQPSYVRKPAPPPQPQLPTPTRLPNAPESRFLMRQDGRGIDTTSPSTANIFDVETPVVEQKTGLARTPRLARIGDPSKANAVPPIESLPTVDTSVVSGAVTPPEMGMVSTGRPTPVKQSPIVSKFSPDIVQEAGGPRPVGSGSTIPRPPSLWNKLGFGEQTGGPFKRFFIPPDRPGGGTFRERLEAKRQEALAKGELPEVEEPSSGRVVGRIKPTQLQKPGGEGEAYWDPRKGLVPIPVEEPVGAEPLDTEFAKKLFEQNARNEQLPVETPEEKSKRLEWERGLGVEQPKVPEGQKWDRGREPDKVTDISIKSKEYQKIANEQNVSMGGVRPERGVPVIHPESTGGFRYHERGGEKWVTHPSLAKPAGPFKTAEEAFDWTLDYQETPEFAAHLREYYESKGTPESEMPSSIRRNKVDTSVVREPMRQLPEIEGGERVVLTTDEAANKIAELDRTNAPDEAYRQVILDATERGRIILKKGETYRSKAAKFIEGRRWQERDSLSKKELPEIDRPQKMSVGDDFETKWNKAIKDAEGQGINWHEYDDVDELRQAIIKSKSKDLSVPQVEPVGEFKELWHPQENDPPEIATKREELAEIVGEVANRTAFDAADVKEVAKLYNELEDFDKLKDMKPSQMRVREGGYSGNEKGVVGPTIVNPKTGRPNLAMGGADPQVLRQLGTSLYTKDRPSVLIQELMQNTVDEMKIAKVQEPVRVAFTDNTKNPVTGGTAKSITFQDFGRGMNENQLYNEFSDVGKSGKRNIQGAAGGFGFAKAAPFLGGDFMRVESVVVENGKKFKYSFQGKPEEFLDQETGVPLERVSVSDKDPTGMRIEVFFPDNKYFGKAKELLQTITEASPDVKDIESFSNYREDDTGLPQSNVNKFTKQGDTALSTYQRGQVEKYQGQPLPNYKDTFSTPENDSVMYYDLDNKERSGSKLIFLNNGVYYHAENMGASIHAMPFIPPKIVIDIKSKVAEGHDKYPFPANRQGLNDEVKEDIRKWINTNIFDPARTAQGNELQNLYDNTNPKPGKRHLVIDSGEKYHPDELARVENSPTLNNIAHHMGDMLEDLAGLFTPDEVVGTTDKYGFRIADPGSGGMNISNPSTSQPDLKTIVTLNPFDGFYSGLSKNWTYVPKQLTLAEASRRFVHLIKHEFAHNLKREEGAGFTWAFSQVDTRFPDTAHYEAQILKAITDPTGNYVAEVPELLREYLEARQRPESKEDILARQGASIETEGGGEPKGISGDDKPDGTGITGGEVDTSVVKTEPEWWGKPAKTVKIGENLSRKLKPTEAQKLDYTEDIGEGAPKKTPLAERFGVEPTEPIIEEPPSVKSKAEKFGYGEPEHKPEPPLVPKPAFKSGTGVADPNRFDVIPKTQKGKAVKDVVKKAEVYPKVPKTVDDIIADKKAKNPVAKDPTFSEAVRALPKRFRNSAVYRALYEPVGVSSLTKLERMGPNGQKLAKILKDERTESNRLGGEHALSTRKVRQVLDKDQQLEVVKLLDGQMNLKDASSQEVRDAYTQLRISTERLGNEAVRSGVMMRNSKGEVVPFQKHRGEYFPHRYPEELFKDLVALEEKLLKAGNSPAKVDAMMKNIRERGERFSSAQHARDFNLPGYDMTLDALERHQYEMAQAITRAKRFGGRDVADAESRISKLIANAEDSTRAKEIVNDYLQRNDITADRAAQQAIYNKIVKWEVGTKLSQFFLTNMGDLAGTNTALGVANTQQAILKVLSDPHGSADLATRAGSYVPIVRKELMRDVRAGKLLEKAYGTNTSEKIVRTISTMAGRANVIQLFEKAKKDKKWAKTLADFVDGDVNEVLKQDSLTDEQVDFGAARGAEVANGVPDELTLSSAMFNKNPLLRLPFLFKRFAFLNTKNMVDAIRRQPDFKRKLAKAAILVGTYQLAGEIIGDAKAAITGLAAGDVGAEIWNRGDFIESKDWPLKVGKTIGGKVTDRIMANFLQSALFGIVGDVTESMVRRPLGKASGAAFGPVGSDLDELVGSIASASGGNWAPAGKMIAKKIPYVGTGLAKRWFKEENKMKGLGGL